MLWAKDNTEATLAYSLRSITTDALFKDIHTKPSLLFPKWSTKHIPCLVSSSYKGRAEWERGGGFLFAFSWPVRIVWWCILYLQCVLIVSHLLVVSAWLYRCGLRGWSPLSSQFLPALMKFLLLQVTAFVSVPCPVKFRESDFIGARNAKCQSRSLTKTFWALLGNM